MNSLHLPMPPVHSDPPESPSTNIPWCLPQMPSGWRAGEPSVPRDVGKAPAAAGTIPPFLLSERRLLRLPGGTYVAQLTQVRSGRACDPSPFASKAWVLSSVPAVFQAQLLLSSRLSPCPRPTKQGTGCLLTALAPPESVSQTPDS